MTRDMRLYFQDILDSIAKIEEYTKDVDEREFLANTQLQDAVLRRLEIIGAAVKSIPNDFRDKYSEIPWKKIAGLRDVLIHEYFGVNMRRTWKVANEDIFDLRQKLLQVQGNLGLTD
jgi:uncharacterized protein with HEPN domain